MAIKIPQDFQEYLKRHSDVWQNQFKEVYTFDALTQRLTESMAENASDLLAVAVSYVSETSNEISIYQKALDMLKEGKNEADVDQWLKSVGFSVSHNKLGQTLVSRIANLFRKIMQVIQNFIRNIVSVLSMTLDEIVFTFSVSPSVSLLFK